MLGDANALVAALVAGRDGQCRVAAGAARDQGALVIERTYGTARRDVATLVGDSLDGIRFVAWDTDLAGLALARMHSSPRLAFVDCLLVERALSGESVLTFDRAVARAIELG
jgi:predicted nucleic-acid-binding protein